MNLQIDTGCSRTIDIASNPASLWGTALARGGLLVLLVTLFATTPVAAQSTGTEFCNTQLAQTFKNLFTLIQFGGPLIGGVVALGGTLGVTVSQRADKIQEYKELRNRALIYGVLIAPLATTILTFLLNYVVAGGSSCGF